MLSLLAPFCKIDWEDPKQTSGKHIAKVFVQDHPPPALKGRRMLHSQATANEVPRSYRDLLVFLLAAS